MHAAHKKDVAHNTYVAHIENVVIDPYIMNASGGGSVTLEQIEKLDDSMVGAIVSKTATPLKRIGNPKPICFNTSMGSINSVGLKNEGFDYYVNIKTKKPYILSIIPNPKFFEDHRILCPDLIEVNLSCPNVPDLKEFESSYEESIRKLSESAERRFGIKIAPILDHRRMIDLLDSLTSKISFITCSNGMKNGLILENQNPVVSKKFGGIGGTYIKPFSLSTVDRLSQHTNISIIGCGGIYNESDVKDYISCGAVAVQVGTHYFDKGPTVFETIINRL